MRYAFYISGEGDNPRPIVHLEWNNIDALYATGTILPIWIGSEEELIATGAKAVRDEVGVGTTYGEAKGKLYEIHDFCLGELTYPVLHIVCSPAPNFAPCQMLMGNAMFEGLTVGVKGPEREFYIGITDDGSAVRNVVVEEKDGQFKVSCQQAEE
ncbi:MAG: hypothetical protein IJ821_06195 [Lachnospiraceae bacterium]|nr:hypothetical protein [Lachnospiraceae bacterium]